MEWTKAEENRLVVATQCGSDWRQIAAIAVELVAARGGTMTAGALEGDLLTVSATHPDTGARVRQHIATQGARNAVLEAERNKAQEERDTWTQRTLNAEEAREAIRRRSLEAGNLERLIAEHGLPAAMRWVVDGEEPRHGFNVTAVLSPTGLRYPCSPACTHDDAATPGHPERVKERSVMFAGSIVASEVGFDAGAEAMRAACWEAVRAVAEKEGLSHYYFMALFKAAIEGATP